MRAARRILLLAILCATYVAAAKLGLTFAAINPSATAIWPPTGIAIAAFLLAGPGAWPAILAGAFIANVLTAGTVWTSLIIAAGNTVEGALGAYLINRFANGRHAFAHAPDVLRFAAVGLVAPLVSATCGVTTLAVSGFAPWNQYGAIWLTWWLGNASGALLITPLIVLFARGQKETWGPEREIEVVLLLLLLAGSALFAFGGLFPPTDRQPLAFICVPFLVWAAFRFGARETALANILVATVATWGTLRGHGPFIGPNGPLVLQAFTATTSVSSLLMAGLVADRARIEEQRLELLHAEQTARRDAEAANLAKDEFLATLSHELRNPLAAIATAVHMAEKRSLPDDKAALAQDIVRRQMGQLTRLVDDLLDVTRVARGKLVLTRGPVDLAQVAARALETLDAARRTERHTLEFEAVPVWVNADAVRLEQVVTNLLTNSFKFTPPGGTIHVTVSRDDREGGRAVLTVTDTGVGIEANLLPRVFDLFAQGSGGAERAQGGLGIGLTLVKSLVDLHDGTVTAASDGWNRGSTFSVRLPVVAQPAAAASRVQPERPSGRRPDVRRVLLVEDQSDLRDIMRVALEAAGHEVFEAANGPSAVDAVERFRPEAAIVDIGLPLFDGYEVARRVRRMPHGRSILLVALTGYGHPQSRDRAEAAGFDLHLVKPVAPERLHEVLLNQTATERLF